MPRLRSVALILTIAGLHLAGIAGAHAAAFTISGVVRNDLGQAVSNVDIDFVDLCSGDNVFLVNDKTTGTGAYSIVVNQGTYDLHFTPPAGSTLAASDIKDYTVAANANLGTTTLAPGRLVSGTVRNTTGTGIAGVDLKFVEVATATRVWVSKDVTTSSGAYAVRVRPGTYDVDYRPPVNAAFATGRRTNLVVGATDVTGLVNDLPVGLRVDGTVKDSGGAVVQNVDLNFYDDCTGEKIPTANDNTDVQGKYQVFVPAGTYSVHFKPPVCKMLSTERVQNVGVIRNTGIGNTTLRPAVAVSGRVLDNLLVPLPNAKLKFYDAVTGSRQGASNDNTDAAGAFNMFLPLGTYNVNIEAPVSKDLLVGRLNNIPVAGATALGDTALVAGTPLTGLLVGPGGTPVLNVNVNVVDTLTRTRVILAHDSSNLDGTFRVVVPAGTYDIQYKPPVCTGLAPDDQKIVTVSGSTALPTESLVVGAHATGLVVDTATPMPNPVAGGDLDFFPAGAALKSYTPGDTTDLTGAYDVLIKPGTYDIDFKPPAGSPLRPVRTSAVGVPVDVLLPDTALPSGWLLSGIVHAQATGLPVDNVEINVYTAGVGGLAWTPHNATALDGTYVFSVDGGTWDLQYVPPAPSGLAPLWRRGVTVASSLLLGDTLLPPLTTPAILTITPDAGSTGGGEVVTIDGSGFHPDATVRIGGMPASSVSVLSSSSISAVTAPHPGGAVSVEVNNPVNLVGSLPAAFTYVEPATPILLTISRSGNDIFLSWQATGQASYTVLREGSPAGFSFSSVLGVTAGIVFTDVGGAVVAGIQYYNVD